MSVKMRQIVEKEICTEIVKSLLIAGFSISVDNGGDSATKPRVASGPILKAMFLTDEDRLFVYKDGQSDWAGWVYLVYGNDGWDVLSDYTVNLEKFIGDKSPVQRIVDKYAD
jgi:hypothetical protein